MSKIKITNANNQHKFICFKIDGLKDGITVGLHPQGDGLSIAYKGDVTVVPFNADSILIDKLNDNSFSSEDEIDNTVVGTIRMSKETYNWLTTPDEEDDDIGYWQPDQVTELDDEAFDAFEKEIMNSEPNMERVEAAKKIFEDVDKVINDIKIEKIVETPVNALDLWKHERTQYGEPRLLKLMDEWGVDGTNYADFRSVIQEHCLNKGLYAFDNIEKIWKEHQESIKNTVEGIKKNGNN